MTPEEAGSALAALAPPITDAQALEAARILAGGAEQDSAATRGARPGEALRIHPLKLG